MKKILALVLAMMMILVAASALAKDSKGNPDIIQGDTGDDEVVLEKTTATEKLQEIMDKIKEANDKDGDPLKGLPKEILELIPAEHKTINEMDVWHLVGDVSGLDELELIFKFETPYDEGEEVTLLIGVDTGEEDIQWIVKTGVANADGDVVVKVTAEELEIISNNPFVAIPVSE